MPHYYADTSALVKNYVVEPGSHWTRQQIASPINTIYISNLALAEMASALAVLYRGGTLRRSAYEMAWRSFLHDARRRYLIQPATITLTYHAAELARAYPLKGYDAVHLATALALAKVLRPVGLVLTLVTGDRQMIRAAHAEGLPVENPFDHAHLDTEER